MSTPIKHPLDDEETEAVNDRLTNIACALDDLSAELREVYVHKLSAVEFDELRAYLGTIREAQRTICEVLYGDDRPPADTSRHPSNGREMTGDDANPHGITITDEVVQARTVDGRPTWYQHNIAADRLATQLGRGLITRGEYEAAMAVLNAQGQVTE